MRKVAVDFGTTNTVVAIWRDAMDAPQSIRLPSLSAPVVGDEPPLIPSLLFVKDGAGKDVVAGYAVRGHGYDMRGDQRFFSSFKRAIAARVHPLAREIDGQPWDESRAGKAFLEAVLRGIGEQEGKPIDELILTVPVQSFEQYLKWLRDETTLAGSSDVSRIRIVDESTAAALGYEVRTPGELILVFDFGGGTLDASLVRMPIAEESGGVVLGENVRLHRGAVAASAGIVEARVVAKSGRVLGGDDIDHWLLEEVLSRNNSSPGEIGSVYSQLIRACEMAKVRLSTHEAADVSVFDPDTARTYQATLTRSQLEDLLDRHDFYAAVHKSLSKVLRRAQARGIFTEDIEAVLMIGGTSQIPSVRRLVRARFGSDRVRSHQPFEAVAHGALNLAAGVGVDDFLYHSYGVRHLSPITGRHEWEEIIPAGTRYPLEEPITLILTASRDGQEALELVIGEVEESAGGVAEVMFGDRAILMVDGNVELRQVVALNDADGSRTVAHLDPPGRAGEDRVRVSFDVDHNRTLRVTVVDLLTEKELLNAVPVVELR